MIDRVGAAGEEALARRTLRGLFEPKRFVPILIVSAALTLAQGSYSRDPFAVPLAAVLCAAFVLIAPVSWRVLFPEKATQRGLRLFLFGSIGVGVVVSLGVLLPRALGMGLTLLTDPSSVLVSLALFLVGGWGLGRDLDLSDRLRDAEARARDLAREAERAQLLALRSHLDPHFLFNTLNAIAEWCHSDGEVAERAVLRLSSMLRAVLAGVRSPAWPLRDELELMNTLFELHLLRDPHLFRVTSRVPSPPPEVSVPPMILLPLAENVMKHGPGAGHRGEVVLGVVVDEGRAQLVVTLENPGAYRGRRPGGEGLAMVEKRLDLAYDGRATLTVGGVGDRTVTEVVMPLFGPSPGARV